MIKQMKSSNVGPYSIADIPQFSIDYRKLIEYARSVKKSVPELSDAEKERFILEATMDDIRSKMIRI